MADPLLFAAYAAAKWLQKGRREEAAAAIERKKQREAEAKARAETTITYWGRDKTQPNSAPVMMTPMLQNRENYELVYKRLGTGDIQEVKPDEKTFDLFQLPDGTRGTKSELEKSIVSRAGQFGTWEDLNAKLIGNRTFTGSKYKDEFSPEYLGPQKLKDVFVFEGATEDGTPVFGRTAQEARQKGAVEGSIGQKPIDPSTANRLGFVDSVLSTSKKEYVPAAPEVDLGNLIVGQTKEGRFVYGEDVAAVRDQGAVKFGQADNEGLTVDGKIQTGPISWFTPDKDPKEETKQFVSVRELNETGEPKSSRQIEIPLWKYQENPDKYGYVAAFQVNADGTRSSIDIGEKSAGKLKGTLDVANSPFNISYRDTEGKKQQYYVSKEYKAPNLQLATFRNWMEQLPRKTNGTPDWTAAGVEGDMDRIRNYAVNLIAENTAVKDPITGDMVPSSTLLADQFLFLRNNFPVLSTIPGLEQAVKIRAGLDEAQVVQDLVQKNSVSADGDPQAVIVAKIQRNVPANVFDPNASSDAAPIPSKIPVAIPFDPKYKQTVDFVMAELAPNGTEKEVENAKVALRTLIEYEYNLDGTVKKGPTGQVIVAKNQPKMDFVDYLVKTKDTSNTPFFASFQNMLKLGSERRVQNAALESDIKTAFNTAFAGDIESGMAVITAFSPKFGPARSRLLFRQITGKNDRLFEKERLGRIQQADSAANAINVIDKMMATYYTRDGQFIDINTSLGQFYVSADGAVHLLQQGMENILPGLVSINQNQAVSAAQNTIFGKDRNGKPSFLSIVDNQLPAEDMLKLATERGYRTVDAFLEAERGAREQNMNEFQKSVAGLGSNDEKVKNLALRNYYRFMVAYTMASAIQGGTGGRTISDQDVQNILRALKMDSVFGQASTEVEILSAAKEMLVDIEKHSRAIGQGGMRAYAALKLQELSIGSVGVGTTIGDISERLEQPGGASTRKDKAIDAMSDADKLKAINDAQGKFADTYNTLEEATAALGEAGVARILAQ